MTLFAGSTSSSNKIKIKSIYPHSCSHAVIHAVIQSFVQSLTPNQFGRSFVLSRAVSTARARAPARRSSREPERPTQKWIVLTHWINPRGHQTKALRSPRAKRSRGRLQGAKRVALVDSLYDQPFVSFAHSRDSPRPLRSPSVSFHVFLLPRHRFAAAIRSDSAP